MKKTSRILSRNQITPGTQVKGANGIGESQPPMKRMTWSAAIVIIATYSASMNSI